MNNNRLAFSPALKKVKFEDLKFTDMSTSKVCGIVLDKQLTPEPDTFVFRDSLLAAFSAETGVNVVQVNLFLTPKQPDFDGLGFLYLEDKIIMPVRLNQSPEYKAWSDHITGEPLFGEEGPFDWILKYSKTEMGMSGASPAIQEYDEYKETGKYLYENAPKKFNEKQNAADRWKYLKKYVNTSGQQLDLTATAALFHQMLDMNGVQGHPPTADLDTRLQEFKALTGYELPAELVTVYKISDGFSFAEENAYRFLHIQDLLDAWKMWNGIYNDWLLDELKSHESDRNKTLPIYTTPYWIPFMTDDNGNYIGIDYAPGKKGLSGQIIVFGGDEVLIKVLAENFNVFLDLLCKEDSSLDFYTKQD